MTNNFKENNTSGKILYLASLFTGIKDHLKMLDDLEKLEEADTQIFTILNDIEIGINDLYILYDEVEKLEKDHE